MKAKSKPLATKSPGDYGVDIAPRLETLKVVEPAKREAGIKVGSVDELVGEAEGTGSGRMKTLVLVEHDGRPGQGRDARRGHRASKLGEVHLLVAGSGVGAVAEAAARSPASARSTSRTSAHLEHQLAENVAPRSLPR